MKKKIVIALIGLALAACAPRETCRTYRKLNIQEAFTLERTPAITVVEICRK